MRGGIIIIDRTELRHDTTLGRRGYRGLRLLDCRLQPNGPELVAATLGHTGSHAVCVIGAQRTDATVGSVGAQGQATATKNAVNVSAQAGCQSACVTTSQRSRATTGQSGTQAAATILAARLSAALSSTGAHGEMALVNPAGLARTTSGIVFFDDFNRSDRALNGDNGWVTDQGTWTIVSNEATNPTAGNFDRNRNTNVSLADGMYETRCKNPGHYAILRIMAPDANDDYHLILNTGSDNSLGYGSTADNRIASSFLIEDSNYHVIKLRYAATRVMQAYWDHVLYFNDSPHATAGPTAAGAVGFMTYGGQGFFDWVLVSASNLLTVTGLSGTQGFQLFDGSNTVIGSSGTQAGGSATLDIAPLLDGLFTGYLQVYQDAGTWAVPTVGARYPAGAGNATDVCGGDVYLLS